jgi:hypothetical protein
MASESAKRPWGKIQENQYGDLEGVVITPYGIVYVQIGATSTVLKCIGPDQRLYRKIFSRPYHKRTAVTKAVEFSRWLLQ